MRLTFLGGANEVGASCTLLEVAGKRILVDAGIRMVRSGSNLPELERLQEGDPIDAVLLTHAHTDHIGALPLVHLAFPRAPIITAAPSKALARVLLQDSLRIMEDAWEREGEVPLYPPHAVDGMLARMATVEPGQPTGIDDGSMVATYLPSGHILGACSITLETPEGTVLFAGDYSLDRQQTIEGMTMPPAGPDLMVTESTYGNRLHADRRKEEQRLVETVARVVAGGGKVLIPSFALGRAQEVILLLLEARRRGHIPDFPVYVDGLVRTMCSVYSQFPEFLTPSLRRRVKEQGCPFFSEGGAIPATRVTREKIPRGRPCAIVASSGMLSGGASRYYAEELCSDPKNAILLTGYQDEESPGHHLLELAAEVEEKGEGLLRIDGQTRRVLCQVGKVGLSAHADARQMLNVVCRVKPRHVVLVHGDDQARQALATTFPESMQVHLPVNGEQLDLKLRRWQRATADRVVFAGMAESDQPVDLAALRARLVERDGPDRRYTASELAAAWHGQSTPARAEAMTAALARATDLFRPDRHRPFLFSAVTTRGERRPARLSRPMDSSGQSILRRARELFKDQPGYRKAGARPDAQVVTLHFDFPDAAAERCRELMAQLARESGWQVELSPKVNQKALTEVARQFLPLCWDILKVRIFPGEPRVQARVRPVMEVPEEELEMARKRFVDLTGKVLEIEVAEEPEDPQMLFDENGRMEQNAAFRRIKKAYGERGVAVLRCSLKTGAEPFIELGFISPQVSERHLDLLAELSRETGWKIQFRCEANQQAIAARARQLMPLEWQVAGEPSFFREEAMICFRTSLAPRRDEVLKVSEQLERETGYQLTLA